MRCSLKSGNYTLFPFLFSNSLTSNFEYGPSKLNSDRRGQYRPGSVQPCRGRAALLLRKEVIQPHLPIRLPCYDFTPIISPTFDGSLPSRSSKFEVRHSRFFRKFDMEYSKETNPCFLSLYSNIEFRTSNFEYLRTSNLEKGWATGFGCCQLSWCDGRCVQGPGTYSPRYADPRLLAIPTSCRRVAACNPNWDRFSGIGSGSPLRCPLFRPL
jgi:hypothetical protein